MRALAQARDVLIRWREEPVSFVREALGAEPQAWQAEALNALSSDRRVSVKSGHGVGKSTVDSWALLWFMTTRFPAKCPCTAPTLAQLRDILWAELGHWHGEMKKLHPVLANQFSIQSSQQDLRFVLTAAPTESFAVGRAGRKENPEALQGFHAENLLFVIDEATGVDNIIFEVAGGALSGDNTYLLLTSNPTRVSGYFYDTHTKLRERFHCMTVSCFDSPMVSPRYIEDAKVAYGQDSNIYRVRVLGEWPTADDDAVIPLNLLEDAIKREVEPINHMPIWGLDVARFGNCRTALAKRQGNRLMAPIQSWSHRDTMQVAGLVMHEYENTPSNELPSEILVDSVGLGAGVVDRLRELGVPVRGINVGETPSGKDRFTNLKAELWWKTREWLEDRGMRFRSGRTSRVGAAANAAGRSAAEDVGIGRGVGTQRTGQALIGGQ